MSATTLLAWSDGYEERTTDAPTTAEVESRIKALDGIDHSLVTVYRDGAHLAVGGSAAHGLVVYCTDDNEEFWQLVSGGDPDTSVQVVAGGQSGSYPASHVASLGDALVAATEFLASGGRASQLRWSTT
jgi:hypothetical protein